jgi:adenylate cyclase
VVICIVVEKDAIPRRDGVPRPRRIADRFDTPCRTPPKAMHGRPHATDHDVTGPGARVTAAQTTAARTVDGGRGTAGEPQGLGGGIAAAQNLGELHPVGGGDPIPLLKPKLLVGRRESSDIVLRFPNVSGTHCELWLESGAWHVRDLKSSNGTKVNGERVMEQRLSPGDRLSVGRHHFEVHYEPAKVGGATTLLEDEAQIDIFGRSLLDSAGLERKRPSGPSSASHGRPRR